MSDSTLEYIRRHYRVPAYRGVRVRVHSYGEGVIVKGADGAAHLMVRLDGHRHAVPCHPCDRVTYLLSEIGVEYTPGEKER